MSKVKQFMLKYYPKVAYHHYEKMGIMPIPGRWPEFTQMLTKKELSDVRMDDQGTKCLFYEGLLIYKTG